MESRLREWIVCPEILRALSFESRQRRTAELSAFWNGNVISKLTLEAA